MSNTDSRQKNQAVFSAAHKFKWFEQITADPKARRGLAAAQTIASKYIKAKHYAWMKLETLAKDLSVDRRTAKRWLDLLVKHGHMARIIFHGCDHTNRYHPVVKNVTDLSCFTLENVTDLSKKH